MKLHHLLLAAMFALPARAADLPTWKPAETGWGGWIRASFVDANGQAHELRCSYLECGNGRATGRAKLYEFSQVGEQVPFEYCDGPFWNRRCNTAYKTTFNTKLSNWELDMAKRKAVQGTHEVSFYFGQDVSALGSTIIVNPPSARRDDVFKPKPATPAPVTRRPVRRDPVATVPPAQLNTLDWKLFGEAMTMTDGGESRHLERSWLSFAEYAEHKSTCYNEDKPACRTAVAAARAKISANMRTTVAFSNKTYKQAYDEAIAKRGDARATAIISILNLLLGEEYGSKNRPDEVMLNAAEKARLSAAAAGLVTASKTGKALLEEYEAALARLDAKDHVGRWQLTKKYRAEVPAAGAVTSPGAEPPVAGPGLSDKPLTAAERDRLSADERAAYDAGIASDKPETRAAAIRRARQWLADHPTAAEFAALDAAGKLRICKDFWAKESVTGSSATGATVTPALPQAEAAVANPEGVMTGDVRRDATAVPTAPATTANRGYQWPPEIRDECQRLLGNPPPQVVLGPSTPVPPVSTAPNLTVGKPIGKPTEAAPPKKEPLTSWNPLLNGAKGGILGAIVGFVLGGPVGMLVGAAVFGVAAWGMSKIGDA